MKKGGNIMKAIRMIRIMVVVSLLATMETQAQIQQQQDPQSIQFRSTGTMAGSGSAYSSTPMLNADGTAMYQGASSAPAQAPAHHGKVRNAGVFDDFDEDMPLGDAAWPLALMAMAYIAFIALRRARKKNQA